MAWEIDRQEDIENKRERERDKEKMREGDIYIYIYIYDLIEIGNWRVKLRVKLEKLTKIIKSKEKNTNLNLKNCLKLRGGGKQNN